MTGSLRVCEPQTEIAKHTHAILKLASGRELRFVDPRRFGRLSVATAFDAAASNRLKSISTVSSHFSAAARLRSKARC